LSCAALRGAARRSHPQIEILAMVMSPAEADQPSSTPVHRVVVRTQKGKHRGVMNRFAARSAERLFAT